MTAYAGAIITALDAATSPFIVFPPTAGEGGPGELNHKQDWYTIPASSAAGDLYRLVRIPSSAKVKRVMLESEAQGAGKFNVSVYYSDSKTDGTQVANQGLIVPTTGNQFFASDVDCTSAVRSDVTNESGNYTLDKRNQPLWKALGLTSDPGGFFDLVAVVHTTAVTTGTGKLGIECDYVV